MIAGTARPRPVLADGRLLVDGRPALLLAGELHNSSGSTRRYLESRWAGILEAGCTTVLAPVPWEQLEPMEERFDPTPIDDLLDGARRHGLRLVLLWFGSWKNGLSTYVPPWVKADRERFPVQHLGGHASAVLSPFASTNAEADARAFRFLMSHLRERDPEHTVVMVQVENEVGSLGDACDRSPAAIAAWGSAVPTALLDAVRDAAPEQSALLRVRLDPAAGAGSTWPEVFGEGEHAQELFMAWHLAAYVEHVAAAGRAEHDLPLFVNAWLDTGGHGGLTAISGGERPGSYPSGGPLPHVAIAWHAAAPTIDFLSPDIYTEDAEPWLGKYRAVTPVLFLPELRKDGLGVEAIYLAVGEHRAIGTAPFGIDDLTDDDRGRIRQAYDQLAAISADILDAQAAGSIRGFVVPSGGAVDLDVGPHRLSISADFANEGARNGYGLVLTTGPGEFVIAGSGVLVRPSTSTGRPAVLHTVHELEVQPPTGRATDQPIRRWLNGDETLSGHFIRVLDRPRSTGLIRFSLLP